MNSLMAIWQRIVDETERAQESDGEHKGLVNNFVIGTHFHRETAFAAKIFAVEYLRTQQERYRSRALWALEALEELFSTSNVTDGIDEPMFHMRRGVKYRKGSIPATILLLESTLEAAKLLSYDFKIDVTAIVDYLLKCYLGRGRFYHDAVSNHHKYTHVVNTSCMAYYFLEMSSQAHKASAFHDAEIDNIRKAIIGSMRADGFWPYLEPKFLQRILFASHRVMPRHVLKAYDKLLGDRSIFFGDAVHHAICLYYLLKGMHHAEYMLTPAEHSKVVKGWRFIEKHLKEDETMIVRFDFSWEPKPTSYRYGNFIDTTAYFYIFDLLQYLEKYQILTKDKSNYYREGLARHIDHKLLGKDSEVPSINAYEGPEEIIDKIIPRSSETVFNKGALLAGTMLDLCRESA